MTHPGVEPITALAAETFLGERKRFVDGKKEAHWRRNTGVLRKGKNENEAFLTGPTSLEMTYKRNLLEGCAMMR
jgi:hypothetical protein